jgi:hypothetical protein
MAGPKPSQVSKVLMTDKNEEELRELCFQVLAHN